MLGTVYTTHLPPGFVKFGISKSPWARIRTIDRDTRANARLIIALPFLMPQLWEGMLLTITSPLADRPRTKGRNAGATEYRRLRLLGVPVPLAMPVLGTLMLVVLWLVHVAAIAYLGACAVGYQQWALSVAGAFRWQWIPVGVCLIVSAWNVGAFFDMRNRDKNFSALVALLAGLAGWLILEL